MTRAISRNDENGQQAAELGPVGLHVQAGAAYAALSVRLELAARLRFRGLSEERREDFTQECRALAWGKLLRLAARGVDPAPFSWRFCQWIVTGVAHGRKLVGCPVRFNVLDPGEQARRRIVRLEWDDQTPRKPPAVGSLSKRYRYQTEVGEDLAVHGTATPADHAAFRLDLGKWLATLPTRHREALALLSLGHGVKEVSRRLRVSHGLITAWRREWRAAWERFQGELK